MTATRAVTFTHTYAPYWPGDVAGFPEARARHLVEVRRVATWHGAAPEAAIDFTTMERAELLRHAATTLGLVDEPPEDVTIDMIREALMAHQTGMPVPPPPVSLDQLDALDRAHLEAFARTKAGLAEIDPAMSDDDLRTQIRAVAEGVVSFVGAPAAKKSGKAARA